MPHSYDSFGKWGSQATIDPSTSVNHRPNSGESWWNRSYFGQENPLSRLPLWPTSLFRAFSSHFEIIEQRFQQIEDSFPAKDSKIMTTHVLLSPLRHPIITKIRTLNGSTRKDFARYLTLLASANAFNISESCFKDFAGQNLFHLQEWWTTSLGVLRGQIDTFW